MVQFTHHKYVRFILYLFWTSIRVMSQDAKNGTTKGNVGSSYFFYQLPNYPRDCTEVRMQCSDSKPSGVYLIKPDGYPEPFEIYCDITKDSTGWTVIHRVQDGSVLLNRNWTEYRSGFGFLSQEFWIGNDKLSYLTNQKSYELRIGFTDANGVSFYVTYNRFRISDEYGDYKLTSVGKWNGTEDEFNLHLCPPDKEGAVYISPDCSQRCFCTTGQYLCYDYQCSRNAVCDVRNNRSQCYCNAGYTGNGINCMALLDCQDIYDRVSTESGIYKVKPSLWGGDPFDVYCNMTDGGGWTVFQRRIDGSQDFYLYWSDYRNGFGTPDRELWLGNDKLHSLTTQKNYELRVDVVDSLNAPFYARHSSFRISDQSDNYRLNLGSYIEGDTGDKLNHINGQPFTTRDRDNDAWSGVNCATYRSGDCGSPCSNDSGWWYRYNPCTFAHLNSPYGSTCLRWTQLPGEDCNLKYTEMKIRPT